MTDTMPIPATAEPTTEETSPVTEPTITPAPTDTVEVPADKTPAEKRHDLMTRSGLYRNNVVYQQAAQTWAIVELSEATREQTAAIEKQNRMLELQVDEARLGNLLAFYGMNQALFPAGVADQMKKLLGITPVTPAAPAMSGPVAVPPLPATPVATITPVVSEADFS